MLPLRQKAPFFFLIRSKGVRGKMGNNALRAFLKGKSSTRYARTAFDVYSYADKLKFQFCCCNMWVRPFPLEFLPIV